VGASAAAPAVGLRLPPYPWMADGRQGRTAL